jgi:hypothetical protein
LSERIAAKEIKSACGVGSGDHLLIENKKGEVIMALNLNTGQVKPDPVEQLLKKHGLNEK